MYIFNSSISRTNFHLHLFITSNLPDNISFVSFYSLMKSYFEFKDKS